MGHALIYRIDPRDWPALRDALDDDFANAHPKGTGIGLGTGDLRELELSTRDDSRTHMIAILDQEYLSSEGRGSGGRHTVQLLNDLERTGRLTRDMYEEARRNKPPEITGPATHSTSGSESG